METIHDEPTLKDHVSEAAHESAAGEAQDAPESHAEGEGYIGIPLPDELAQRLTAALEEESRRRREHDEAKARHGALHEEELTNAILQSKRMASAAETNAEALERMSKVADRYVRFLESGLTSRHDGLTASALITAALLLTLGMVAAAIIATGWGA